MSALVKQETPAPPADLSGRLQWLRSLGNCRLSWLDDGWVASVKLPVSVAGATFEVRSDFTHQNPDDAVATLIKRVIEAINKRGT